jgi:L-ribulose-5-phosphate 3-epimerase
MKIGILQGRLSKPIDNKMQEFPIDTWENEFNHIKHIGILGIEWLITPKDNLTNPFFTNNNLPKNILSVCVDTMVNTNFYKKKFLNKNLIPVLNRMTELKIKKVVIPLLEDSSVTDISIRYKFLKNFVPISVKYPNIDFCFEFECKKEIVMKIVNRMDNFFITYDTGNFTSFYKENINHQELIQYFGNKIKNIHIKDRNYQGETKLFGFGDTNFKVIFEILKKINYNENVILQLAREVECNEVNYISETLKKINKII